MVLEICLIMVKCYTTPRYVHLIWNKYMKSTWVVMLSLLGFVACESKSNYTIFSTSLIKKHLFRDIFFNFQIIVLISIVSSYLSSNKLHSVHPSSFSAGGGGVWFEPSNIFSKRRARQDLRGWLLGKIGVSFFRGLQFLHKK